jgi:hypothetical protein
MNVSTAMNLTIEETIKALYLAWAHPLSSEVHAILISNLCKCADALSDAQYRIRRLEKELHDAYGELEQANAASSKNSNGETAE